VVVGIFQCGRDVVPERAGDLRGDEETTAVTGR
jgi:hypothetical protein